MVYLTCTCNIYQLLKEIWCSFHSNQLNNIYILQETHGIFSIIYNFSWNCILTAQCIQIHVCADAVYVILD